MGEEQITKKKNIVLPIIIGIVALALIGCTIAVVLYNYNTAKPQKELKQHLETGDKYLSALDYEKAILAYEAALTIDPKNKTAFLGIINANRQNGDEAAALAAAQRAYGATGDEQFSQIAEELKAIIAENDLPVTEPSIPTEEPAETPVDVDLSSYEEFTVSNYSYQYRADDKMMHVSFLYEAPIPVEFWIADWQEGEFSNSQIAELIPMYESIWGSNTFALNATGGTGASFPIKEEDLGKSYYVILFARGEGGKIVGYTQVPVTVE